MLNIMIGVEMEIKRRGRPPVSQVAPNVLETLKAEPVENLPAVEVEKPQKRRRRVSVGGFSQKLGAPQRDGYVRRWTVDHGNKLADAQDLAYDFVNERGIKTDGPDTRVRRLTGTNPDGSPQYSYLMETPEHEYAYGVAEREEKLAETDEAIYRGVDPTGKIVGKIAYGGEGSITTGS